MDRWHNTTDGYLEWINNHLDEEYSKAQTRIEKEIGRELSALEAQDKAMLEMLNNGQLNESQYYTWRGKQLLHMREAQRRIKEFAEMFVEVDRLGYKISNDKMVDVYVTNYNATSYEVEKALKADTGADIATTKSARRELTKPKSVSQSRLKGAKDLRWSRRNIASAIEHGIKQNKPLQEIIKDIASQLIRNLESAKRNARTLTTRVENRAKMAVFKRLEKRGIPIKKVWVAVLDERTRHSHVILDGEARGLDEPFSNGCRFPADPNGEPSEIFNCRCYLTAEINGNEVDMRALKRDNSLGTMTYDEWLAYHRTTKT